MNRLFCIPLLVATALLSVACQTTGNPREGGLFGWSRADAQARQVELRQQAQAAEATRDAEQETLQARRRQQLDLEAEVAELDRQMRLADAESVRLESQVAQLVAKNRAASKREQRLLGEISERRAQGASSKPSPSTSSAGVEQRRQQLDSTHDYHARMSAAILRMLAD